MFPIPTTSRRSSSLPAPSSPELRTTRMQERGRPGASAINTTRSKDIGPVDGMAARIRQFREMPGTNGSRAEPRREPWTTVFTYYSTGTTEHERGSSMRGVRAQRDWLVHQPDRSKDHKALGRSDRQQ